MKRPTVASVVCLLAMAGIVHGQTHDVAGNGASKPADCAPPGWASTWAPIACEAVPNQGFVTAEVEYLLWWLRNERIDSRNFSTDPDFGPGLLDSARRDARRDPFSGVRLSIGYWLEDYDPIVSQNRHLALAGVEVSGFLLAERTQKFLSGASPALIRPFFDLNNRTGNFVIVARPGLAVGQLEGTANLQFHGAEANVWCNVCGDPPGQVLRADVMAGVRYLNLETNIQIDQTTRYEADLTDFPEFAAFAGSTLQVRDAFAAENRFYGGQIGARLRVLLACAELSGTFKYALGTTNQRLNVNGGQLLTAPGGTQTAAQGGLLALASNSGEHDRNRITHVPEVNVKLSIHLSRHLSMHGGYSLLYVSNVVRAGGQIDRVIDVTQIPNFPGDAGETPTELGRPAVLFKDSGLLVQGVDIGFSVAW